MTFLKRLRVLTAILGATAALAAVGTTLLGDFRAGPAPKPDAPARPDGSRVIDELAVTKFSTLPVVTYQVRSGETLFAWQIKPTLEAAPARPRDVLVLVDTSASQAGKPLHQARAILTGLAETLTPDDRVSVWTVSTPAATRAITKDFQPATSEDVKTAAVALTEVEYGSGATDLKHGLNQSLATLAPNRGRQQIVLFLGDGESAFNPVSEKDRIDLGTEMDRKDVLFFAVPLGVKVNPANLHGFASLTGGSVVRVQEDLGDLAKRTEFVARLRAALDAPVLKAASYKFGDEVAELYPTKLPPLRADRPTLVMGKLAKAGVPALTATVAGKVGSRDVKLNLTHDLPPSQADHYFLNLMLDQWRGAPHKDAPAMLQADRALALASTQVKLYRDEFLTQAVWAMTKDQFNEAEKLYAAARKIDPNDPEANSGLALVEKMKAGKVTRADLEKKVHEKSDALKIGKDGAARQVVQEFVPDAQPKDPPAGGAGQPPVAGTGNPPAAIDLINEARARRQVEEQRYRILTDATIRRGRQQLRTDPDAAYQDLKRQRDEILGYEGIGADARVQMVADLEAVMREVFVKGAEIKRQAAAEREQISRTRTRINEFDHAQAEEDRTKARIDAFRQLMQQARYELAYQEAQLMIQERISKGQDVPAASVASYIIGQQATQLREWRELVRIREDRYLLAMMQTEKSHIPYPDEPPVHFPPASVWRELTGARKERYQNSVLGPEASPTQKKIQSVLENQRVSYEKGLNDTPLFELLQDMAKRYDVTFIIMEEFFKAEGQQNIKEAKPNLSATRLEGLTLGGFLDIVLQAIPGGATYIVRPDYIEVTTFNRRLTEKVTRVFPVADLTIPIPNSVNQQTLYQNQQFQNNSLAIFGAASLYGGGLSNFIGGNNNNNGGGNAGFPGGGAMGAGGAPGGVGFGGGNTGSIVGQGGNVGQFGNLGGQFGLQGGDQSALLMGLIFETVAKGEWANTPPPATNPGGMEEESALPKEQQNSLGYYPPARALIVRGTSRYHTASSIKLKGMQGMAAAPGGNRPGGGVLVIGPGGGPDKPVGDPAGVKNPADPAVAKNPPKPAGDPAAPVVITGDKPRMVDPKLDAVAMKKKLDKDPRRMWHQAIDWTITDPGVILASAEFLMEFNEFKAAAEVLKANLRKGLATDDWAHEALAIALQMDKANPVEVERAAVSAIDLDPTDPKAYLKAAKVEDDLKNHEQAVAFCRRSADFAPDRPTAYANALVYAQKATDVKSDAVDWAMLNLLRRDWPADGTDYHAKAKGMLPGFVARFNQAGIKADGLNKALVEETQRDLVIELLWQGSADLDLVVAEPSGSVCSATAKRTTGGGFLRGDLLEQKDDGRAEVYTVASGFTGTYKVSVKTAFGRPVGNTATIKVTKFKGTAKESHDLFTVDLANAKSVEVKLDGGSRTELAAVTEDAGEYRTLTTGSTAERGPSGFGGGVGPAGSVMSAPVAAGSALPVVTPSAETRLPGVGGSADLRMGVKLNADRKTMTVNVNPVFSTAGGKDVPMPKVPLLPGSEK